MTPWMLLGWPAALALFVGLRARGPMMNEITPQEDAEQASYLAAWMDLKNRRARKDKRGQGEAIDRLQNALHAKLRAEMRR